MTSEERIAHMTPYYSQDGITIYNAPWEEVWASLGLAHKDVALLWADPPYGIALDTSARWAWLDDFAEIEGDAAPFDPRPLLALARPSILWGANHYASRLPDSKGWIAWDKGTRNGLDLKQAEIEFAWTNAFARPWCFRHMWSGAFRDSERGTRFHPTQKPAALSVYAFQRAKLQRGDLVFSPYLGSGPEARAALDMGLHLIGCEIVPKYCAVAVSRLRQRPLFTEGV